jgi:hypothetical protein
MNGSKPRPGESSNVIGQDYETPVVYDLGKVFDVTSGDTLGASDESGQRTL